MHKVVTVGLILLSLVSFNRANAREAKAFVVQSVFQRSPAGSQLIRLRISDAQPKSGVCPYYVKNLQYIEAVKVLNVDVFQELCLNDRFGASSGDLYWAVPKGLAVAGSRIEIVVNGKLNTALIYDEQIQSFRVED